MGLLTTQVVVLSGPPASGKDIITQKLVELDERFRLFRKLKCGTGRSEGYRMVGRQVFDDLLATGQLAQAHERYGNVYAVDLPSLEAMIDGGLVPVIHNGRMSDFSNLAASLARWQVTHVVLQLPRDEAARRIRRRATGDTDARLAAYDEEAAESAALGNGDALVIDTSVSSIDDAARAILRSSGGAVTP